MLTDWRDRLIMKIEDAFEQLDGIIAKLEDKDTPLEDAFKEYEQGIRLVKECNASLDKVEKQIIILQNNDSDEEKQKEE